MKKLLTLTTAACALLSTAAHAEGYFKPYVGLDFQRTQVNYENTTIPGISFDDLLEDSLNGINLHVGNRFSDYFGLELGYFRTAEEDKSVGPFTLTELQLQGVTLDALGYLPVTKDKKLELIGTLGASYTKADVSIPLLALSGDDSEWGGRVGAGLQYNITDSLNLRGLVRYQTIDFDGVADNALVYSVGLNYSF